MENIESFRNWYRNVMTGAQPGTTQVTSKDALEFWSLYEAAGKAMSGPASNGKHAKLHGVGNIRENGFSIRSGEYTFTVLPEIKSKGVAATSVAAYHAKDHSEQALLVAKTAIALHTEGIAWVSDRLLESKTGLPAARISARRNEILDAGGVTINGEFYTFAQCDQKIKCPVTQSTVNGWALRKPNTLF